MWSDRDDNSSESDTRGSWEEEKMFRREMKEMPESRETTEDKKKRLRIDVKAH